MLFDYLMGEEFVLQVKDYRIKSRTAVRAIIFNGDKILLVSTNKGDYKFPGGGLKKDETNEIALAREVEEETGYKVSFIGKLVGRVIEKRVDIFDNHSIFEMKSYYYICEISNDRVEQNLDDYEVDLNLTPIWIGIEKAIDLNNKNLEANPWVKRENYVLKQIKDNFNIE